jgi:hypothetical protein
VAQTHASDGGRLDRLAEEQAALRGVAAVAHGTEPSSLFGLVAERVSRVLRVPLVSVVRFEDDRTATERASFSPRRQPTRGFESEPCPVDRCVLARAPAQPHGPLLFPAWLR